MLILALDTSTQSLSCALCEVDPARPAERPRVLAEAQIDPPIKHGDALPGALFDLLAKAGKQIGDVQGLAAGLGPGSFTGLRVGLAAAKALAYARKLPLVGTSSLRALALAAQDAARVPAAQDDEARVLVPTLEARKNELYAEAVARDGRVLAAEAAMRAPGLVALVQRLGVPAAVFGAGALACRDELQAAGLPDGAWLDGAPPVPPAWAVAQLCGPRLSGAAYDREAVFALAPNYVKPSEAEVALAEGRVGGLPKK